MAQQNLKDHRQIGTELDLFSFNELAPGAIFWHHKGYIIYKTLVEFLRQRLLSEGYMEISTPVMVKSELFKRSGHWDFYKDSMFNLSVYDKEELREALEKFERGNFKDRIISLYETELTKNPDNKLQTYLVSIPLERKDYPFEADISISKNVFEDGAVNYLYSFVPAANYSLKPMNCPGACLVYKTRVRSYQDLPMRLSDFGVVHRNELSGVLGGAFRVRQLSIDDAHHFVRPDQIQQEVHNLILLVVDFYKLLGFKPEFYFSTKPDKAMGDPRLWEVAEKDLEKALKDAGVKYDIKEKDGAFYGPKIDIHIKDSQDRDWQLATIQLDFQIPEKMKLEYIDKDGKPKRPVIVHRAILGSFERFIGILTEHYQGAFPLWLSPVQVAVLPIADRHNEYARKVTENFQANNIRAELDVRSERLDAKVRDHTLQKVPYLAIIGDSEIDKNQISIRTRLGKEQQVLNLSDFVKRVKEDIDKKT